MFSMVFVLLTVAVTANFHTTPINKTMQMSNIRQ